jgi:hypothetical protein
MDRSSELRWFSQEKFTDVEYWFKQHEKKFKNEWQRSDFYIHLDGYTKLSFKIREGKAEIKTCIDNSSIFKISDTCSGVAEHWIKWSKSLSRNLQAEQILEDKNQLIELKKERLLVTYATRNNNVVIVNESVDEGCQVELTRLSINNHLYYSFGFEAFGANEKQIDYLKSVTALVCRAACDKTTLSVTDSYSYPTLLSRIIK